ncbi:MAG: ribonuclease HII [Bacteroidales bacterium]|nr:ribonuclease HII [Bacteroidales bacterium]
MLLKHYNTDNRIEAGCDEAGRGCLAGPVFAAAVVLPDDYDNPLINDSKQLNEKQRRQLRAEIEQDAVAWAVCSIDNEGIDQMNILWASLHAMNLAVQQLKVRPQFLLIDGNRFRNETDIDYKCFVKGDAKYMSIAAASILAKTHRDEYMEKLHEQYPDYHWDKNKGYPTKAHYEAIARCGITPYHRKSFTLDKQLTLDL